MYSMNSEDELLYKQFCYPQHDQHPYYIDSYVNPGSRVRIYRLLKKLGDVYIPIGSYRYLKNAIKRKNSECSADLQRP